MRLVKHLLRAIAASLLLVGGIAGAVILTGLWMEIAPGLLGIGEFPSFLIAMAVLCAIMFALLPPLP